MLRKIIYVALDHASYSLHLVQCFHLSVSSLCIVIDHVEQGHREPSEPALVEDIDPEEDQGKHPCILPHPLSFIYFFLLLYDS
jgi:hypothetical protein